MTSTVILDLFQYWFVSFLFGGGGGGGGGLETGNLMLGLCRLPLFFFLGIRRQCKEEQIRDGGANAQW